MNLAISLIDGNDGGYLRDMFLEVPLDPELERDAAGRATHASPVEPDFHDTIVADVDEFDIAAVRLDSGPDQVEDPNDTILEWKGCLHD